jgi:hypothetical protein
LTHNLTDLWFRALPSSANVNSQTLRQVKQVVRNLPTRPWFSVIGRKRGTFRGLTWLLILRW